MNAPKHTARNIIAAMIAGAAVAGPLGAAATASAAPADTETAQSAEAKGSHFEEHQFSGSSTAAEAFKVWFEGGEFVEPAFQTYDLTQLRVNEYETAHAGDVIYKDDQGRFWIKQDAVVR